MRETWAYFNAEGKSWWRERLKIGDQYWGLQPHDGRRTGKPRVGEVVFGAGGMRQHWAKDVEVVRGAPMMI